MPCIAAVVSRMPGIAFEESEVFMPGIAFIAESFVPGIAFMAESFIPGMAFIAESFMPAMAFIPESFLPDIAFIAESVIPGIDFVDESFIPGIDFIPAASFVTGTVLSGMAIDPIPAAAGLAAGVVALAAAVSLLVAALFAGVFFVADLPAVFADAEVAVLGAAPVVVDGFAGIFIPPIPAIPARLTESARAAESRCCFVCCAPKGDSPATAIAPMTAVSAARRTMHKPVVSNIPFPK